MKHLRFALTAGLLVAGIGPLSAEPVKLTMAWVAPVSNWPTMLYQRPELTPHQDKSYKTDLVRYKSTEEMITGLASGEIDIALLSFSALALAIENAQLDKLRIIASDFQDGVPGYYSDEYYVRKDSGIKTVADLKGKVIGINGIGGAMYLGLRIMLQRAGLKITDVTTIEAGLPNMRPMLSEKKVDMVFATMPFAADLYFKESANALFIQRDAMGVTEMIVWVASKDFIERHRAALVDLMADSIRAAHFYLDPKNHAAAVQTAAKFTKQSPSAFEGWLYTNKDFYRNPDLKPDLAALKKNIDDAVASGLIPHSLDVENYADGSLIRDALTQMK
jgi:NitT/TauT family transport system substrate-binding protein